MIGCLRTHVPKQPIIALYFEFENELSFIASWPGSLYISRGHRLEYKFVHNFLNSRPCQMNENLCSNHGIYMGFSLAIHNLK